MNKYLLTFALPVLIFAFTSCNGTKAPAENWIQLFNGEDLAGWTPKIAGFEAGENYAETFRVENGVLRVTYEDYPGEFNGHFGHLFTDDTYSNYHLRIEYRFVGEQAPNAPGWAYRNNGVMLHSQDPATMGIWQNFPISVEAQLLGGNGTDERPTANVCTPGTTVAVDGIRRHEHCIAANAPTFHGDQWVEMDIVVYSDSLVHHIIAGDTVLTYTALEIGGDPVDASSTLPHGPLKEGRISIQAEGHPTEFRKIELLELK